MEFKMAMGAVREDTEKLTLLSSRQIGSVRCHRDRSLQVGPRPRCLPACVLQEHPRDRPGHQRLEAPARRQVPRERQGEERGCPYAPLLWLHRPHCPRYASIPRMRFSLFQFCSRPFDLEGTSRGPDSRKGPGMGDDQCRLARTTGGPTQSGG